MLPDYPPLSQQIGVWRALSALLALLLLAAGVFSWGRARQLHVLSQRLETQRLLLEQQEAEREELRLPQITLDHSSVGILWVSWDSRVRYANPASAQLLAAAQADMLLGRRLAEGYPALNGDRWRALWNRLRGVETLPSFEAQCLRLDGVLLPLDITLSFVRFASAEYLVVFMTDASERYRAREALKENELSLAASRQSLRALAAHLESAREEEKAHLAREVHDELGQHLTVLRLEMSMCEIGFGHLDQKLQDRLHSMKRLIEQTFQIVRDVASALRPPILDAGIASAVEWQMRRFEQRSQIPVRVTVPDTPLALSDEQAIGLFRILQEALTNVLRHAQANSVSLLLESSDDGLLLCLSDDGIGFDPQARRTEVSFGLVGMQERVLLLGGRLEIDSRPLHGTTLKVWVPFNESESS
jgi:signal transduction histidine kinase